MSAEKAFDRSVSWYQRPPQSEGSSDLMNYGEALYYAWEFAKAGEVFERACSTTPNSPECLGWAGVVKARMGQRDQALALRDAIGKTDSTPRSRIRMQATIGQCCTRRPEGAVSLRGPAHGWVRRLTHRFHTC
jgi:Tfp pilus assembly protein PilF